MLFAIIFVMLLLLVGRSAETNSHMVPELPDEPVSTYSYELYGSKENNFHENLDDEYVPQIVHDEVHSPERCDCGGHHYIGEDLRSPTPPLVMREPREWGTPLQHFQESFQHFQEALYQFENIHRITYHQFETERHYYSFIIWTDEPLRDFFFASLDVAGHYWYDDKLVIGTREVIFEIDELLPGDAIIFDVAFSHYFLPRAGVGFTDSNGANRRMFILESMRGGCWPMYFLAPLSDDWAAWR